MPAAPSATDMANTRETLIVVTAGIAALLTIALGITVSVIYAGVYEYQQLDEQR